jgi:hypothetical protein
MTEIVECLGYHSLTHSQRTQLGSFVATQFRMTFPTESMKKTERYVMGEMRFVNAYAKEKQEWLTGLVSQWCQNHQIVKKTRPVAVVPMRSIANFFSFHEHNK